MAQLNQYPCLNTATLAMLKKSTAGNKTLLTDLFQSFIDDSQELINELKLTGSQNDFERFYTAVHTLKGLCGTIGCSRMFEVLKIMDSLNKDKNFDNSKTYIEQLNSVFLETCKSIEVQVFNPSVD